MGGNSLPFWRCDPGRGQERERARCCPVFVCCLRMHSDGGMDHLGEAAGSRGAAALHYDREVRAISRQSAGPVGRPRESLLTPGLNPPLQPPARPLPPPHRPKSRLRCSWRWGITRRPAMPPSSSYSWPTAHPFPIKHHWGFTLPTSEKKLLAQSWSLHSPESEPISIRFPK